LAPNRADKLRGTPILIRIQIGFPHRTKQANRRLFLWQYYQSKLRDSVL